MVLKNIMKTFMLKSIIECHKIGGNDWGDVKIDKSGGPKTVWKILNVYISKR